MPSIFTHPAIPLAIGLGLGSGVIPGRLMAAGAVASILPDLDVISFHFGIAYGSDMGHRGLSHSVLFAIIVAAIGAMASRTLQARALTCFVFLFVATASHGLLDSFTTGGRGIAFLWPWSSERFFAPWQVIAVSPIGARFFSSRGVAVLMSELLWVWLPCAVLTLGMWQMRRQWRTTSPRS